MRTSENNTLIILFIMARTKHSKPGASSLHEAKVREAAVSGVEVLI